MNYTALDPFPRTSDPRTAEIKKKKKIKQDAM